MTGVKTMIGKYLGGGVLRYVLIHNVFYCILFWPYLCVISVAIGAFAKWWLQTEFCPLRTRHLKCVHNSADFCV